MPELHCKHGILPENPPFVDSKLADVNEAIRASSSWVDQLRNEISKSIVGQRYMIDRMIIGLLTGGHILIDGVPGLGKTSAIKALARSIDASFQRIQFTPDMMPADIIGTQIYDPKKADFFTKNGPIFSNIVLADEINRAPAKVQSALLECMQEMQVTIGGTTSALPELFMVLATENPIEHDGTYPLSEAQIDRFLLKLKVEYPSKLEEIQILSMSAKTKQNTEIHPVVTIVEIMKARNLIDEIFIAENVKEYIVDLVTATRTPKDYGLDIEKFILFGASPRTTIALALAAKAWAFLQGRSYVTPQDVKTIGLDVLRHRIITSYIADTEDVSSEVIAAKILNTMRIP